MSSEIEKVKAVSERSQTIGGFLEWLQSKEYVIASWGAYDNLYQERRSIEEWLAQYFGIDLKKLEKEKRALLDEIRK